MPDIAVSPDQRERLRWIQRRLAEDVEYGHVRPCDALDYLLDHAETTGGLSGITPESEETEGVEAEDRQASRSGTRSDETVEPEVDDRPTDASSVGFGTLHTSPSANVVRIGNATTDRADTNGQTDSGAETDDGDDSEGTDVESDTETDTDTDADDDTETDTDADDDTETDTDTDDDTETDTDADGDDTETDTDADGDDTETDTDAGDTSAGDSDAETDDADGGDAGTGDGEEGRADATDATDDGSDGSADEEDGTPDEAGTTSALPTPNAMMNLLETHGDKWREASGGEEKYEVDLPDGSTEGARTKDDVKAVLFKQYR